MSRFCFSAGCGRQTYSKRRILPILCRHEGRKYNYPVIKTTITATQINKLSMDDDIENTYFIDIHLDDILNPDINQMAERVVHNFGKENVVIVHVSKLDEEIMMDEGKEKLIDNGITKEKLAVIITDYLSDLSEKISELSSFILITIGGETSYKCLRKIDCKYLQMTDTILPAVSLCIDSNARFIVTKSGNMGSATALIDIINYFKYHEKE